MAQTASESCGWSRPLLQTAKFVSQMQIPVVTIELAAKTISKVAMIHSYTMAGHLMLFALLSPSNRRISTLCLAAHRHIIIMYPKKFSRALVADVLGRSSVS